MCSIVSMCIYASSIFLFFYPFLSFFLLVCFFLKFACLFSKEREREKEGMRLNEWIEFGRRWVKRNCDQNIKKIK